MHKLNADTAKLITSLQVITNVESVIKELIENSLDAEATSIEVRLENYGLSKIEVRDNGTGISESDIEFAAQVHYTSKLTHKEDLEALVTYGFRGEALSALCKVSEVSVTTRTKNDSFGTKYSLNSDGTVIATRPSHLPQGTTVTATNLFASTPVRSQLYKSSGKQKQILKNVEDIIMSFAIVKHSVRFSLVHNKSVIWKKPSCTTLMSALENVLGVTTVSKLAKIENEIEESGMSFSLYVPVCSDSNLHRKSNDRCFVFINGRPVRDKEFDKILKRVTVRFHDSNSSLRWPVAVLLIQVPLHLVDANVEANKTKVLINGKQHLLLMLNEKLTELYASIPDDKENHVEEAKDTEENNKSAEESHEVCTADAAVERLENCRQNDTLAVKRKKDDIITEGWGDNSSNQQSKEANPEVLWSHGQYIVDSDGNAVEPVKVLTSHSIATGTKEPTNGCAIHLPVHTELETSRTEEASTVIPRKSSKKPTVQMLLSPITEKKRTETLKTPTRATNKKHSADSSLITEWASITKEKEPRLHDLTDLELQPDDQKYLPEQITHFELSMSRMIRRLACKKDLKKSTCPQHKLVPIGVLKNQAVGVCISLEKKLLYLVNLMRLKEMKIFNSLMQNHSLPIGDLSIPILFPLKSLPENAKMGLDLIDFKPSNKINPEVVYHDERILKNGFSLYSYTDSKGDKMLSLKGMTLSISYYGWDDLTDILKKIGILGKACKLHSCRPTKVTHYLQAEAVRMARSHPPDISFPEDFVEATAALPVNFEDWKCFHNKTVVQRIYSLC